MRRTLAIALAALAVAVVLVSTAAAAGPTSPSSSEHRSQADIDSDIDRMGSFLRRMFLPVAGEHTLGDAHGGSKCATCTILVTLVEQYAALHSQSIQAAFDQLCSFMPSVLRTPCRTLVDKYGATIAAALAAAETPDVACKQATLCTDTVCKLRSKTSDATYWSWIDEQKPLAKKNARITVNEHSDRALSMMEEVRDTPWDFLKKEALKVFDSHLALVDLDNDTFSTADTFRGASWRGRDCNDFDRTIYPGRKTNNGNANIDYDCNGIFGKNPQGQSWEDVLCKNSGRRGVAVLGDSAAAHFHLPRQWLSAAEITPSVFEHALFVFENEADWPQLSTYTGYTNESYGLAPGDMVSIYDLMRQRNLCNHRDFQNIGVNGARVGAMKNQIMYTLNRDQKNDHPLLLFYALIGNDVCSGHQNLDWYTHPDEFRADVLKALSHLDTVLPANSHVVIIGLVDGRILYNAMHNRTHPIGVTYTEVYDYLNCLEISPCWGWLNSNETVRNVFSQHAFELNDVYADILKTNKFANFDLIYYSLAELVEQSIQQWLDMGREVYELIDPVDGFHPSQDGVANIARVLWEKLSTEHPSAIGDVNPNNNLIRQLFGNQGGY